MSELMRVKSILDEATLSDNGYSTGVVKLMIETNTDAKHDVNEFIMKYGEWDAERNRSKFEIEVTISNVENVRGAIDSLYTSMYYGLERRVLGYITSYCSSAFFPKVADDLLYTCTHLCKSYIGMIAPEDYKPPFTFTSDMKHSRIIRRIVDSYLKSKDDFTPEHVSEIERQYAKVSDSLSTKKEVQTWYIGTSLSDFMRMSHGNSWRSCHSIRDDREYQSGTISYALDSTTALLYRESERNNENLISRQVVYINEQRIAFGRKYGNETSSESVNHALLKLFGATEIECDMLDIRYGRDSTCYPDSDHHKCTYAKFDMICNVLATERVGQSPVCVSCGESHYNGDTLQCDDCRPERCICIHCDDVVRGDDIIWVNDSDCVCQSCYNDRYFTCCECGEVHRTSFGMSCSEGMLCEDCYDNGDWITCEECGEIVRTEDSKTLTDNRNGVVEWYCRSCR
jgi:hypothetical protein